MGEREREACGERERERGREGEVCGERERGGGGGREGGRETHINTHTHTIGSVKQAHFLREKDREIGKGRDIHTHAHNVIVLLSRLILCFQYAEYEQVVVEDRIEKEKARRKAELEAEELKAAIRVSSCYCSLLKFCHIF